jgi:beta-lactamase regulating signal transducer with metallopeptidase domain
MSAFIRWYPGDRPLNLLLVAALAAALASSAAWLISRRLAGNAALRHLVLFSALICCLASPAAVWFCAATGLTLASIPVLPMEQARTVTKVEPIKTAFICPPPRHSTDAPSIAAEQLSPPTGATDESCRCASAAPEARPDAAGPMAPAPGARRKGGPEETPVSFRGIATVATLVWAAGAFLMLARLARNCWRVVGLRRSSRPLQDEARQLLLQEVADTLGMRRVPLLLVSGRTVAPLAVGFGRPAVILPERLLGALGDDEFRDVLTHEAAHLRRGDQRIVLLQELARALYWPIVTVHALNCELRQAREELCDNAVLLGRDAIRYGRTLLHVAEQLVEARPLGAAVGIFGGRGELERRIAGLIDPRRNTMTKVGRKTAWVVALTFIVIAAGISATRFAASAAPAGEGRQALAQLPADNDSAGPAPSDKREVDKATPQEDASEVEARRRETQVRAFGLRHRHEFMDDPFEDGMIGGLVDNNWWIDSLPLAPAQASAIKKLDKLLRDANDRAALLAADYMDTNPPDYQEFSVRLYNRMHETVRHGVRTTALGLLTEPQAGFVLQRYMTGSDRLYILRDKNVQDLLGVTASQNKQLDKVGEDANRREARLNLWTVDPKEQKYVNEQMAANAKQMNEEAMNVLTPGQRLTWARLTAARSLPAKPMELVAPSEDEAARIKLEDASPVFRFLADKADALELSDAQKKLLDRLEEITREGLYWISLRNPKDAVPAAADRASQEFLKQAEQVALFGILTEKQARLVGVLC